MALNSLEHQRPKSETSESGITLEQYSFRSIRYNRKEWDWWIDGAKRCTDGIIIVMYKQQVLINIALHSHDNGIRL